MNKDTHHPWEVPRLLGAGLLWYPGGGAYRGTSLIRTSAPLGPYSRTISRAIWWSWGKGLLLMSEIPLHP